MERRQMPARLRRTGAWSPSATVWLAFLVVLAFFLSQGRAQIAPVWALESTRSGLRRSPAGFRGADDVGAVEQLSRAFVNVAEKIKPAVVYIRVEGKAPVSAEVEEFFREGPFRRYFEFPERRQEPRRYGVGSGVIVRVQGDTAYILTNNHVVELA